MKESFEEEIKRIDGHRVYETYERWPDLAREGFRAEVGRAGSTRKKAYVLGMGGSASAGDIIAGWISGRPGFEMAVFKGQVPLANLGDAVAVACSASGNTQETIVMLRDAIKKGARAVAISGGGKIREEAERLGITHVQIPEVVAPRYMMPFFVFSTLAVLNQWMELNVEEEAESAFSAMDEERKFIGTEALGTSNPAKTLAEVLEQKVPAIYGALVTRGVGIRFKNALNENAKTHALFDGLPEAFHNEIEAWEDPRSDFLPVFLRHPGEVERDRLREDSMMSILEEGGRHPVEVRGRGTTSLAQLLSMSYRLDMASYYLAIILGRDPYPTPLLDRLKKGN